MYPYKQSNYVSGSMYPGRTPNLGPCMQLENPQPAVKPHRQPVNPRQARVHFTGYNRGLTTMPICRCAQPESHGDAYSYADGNANVRYNGIQCLDVQGRELDYNNWAHRSFDLIGKDYVASVAELAVVDSQVLHPDTIRALREQRETLRRIRQGRGNTVTNIIPYDAIWYGPVNPKGVKLRRHPSNAMAFPSLVQMGYGIR
jgi:hypothetical protein